ncbi:hypothetical protein Trydic_g19293 [Trypoxylus dichotomus]
MAHLLRTSEKSKDMGNQRNIAVISSPIQPKPSSQNGHNVVKEEEARKSMKDFEDTRRYPDASSKFQDGRHWRKMERRREKICTKKRHLPAAHKQRCKRVKFPNLLPRNSWTAKPEKARTGSALGKTANMKDPSCILSPNPISESFVSRSELLTQSTP